MQRSDERPIQQATSANRRTQRELASTAKNSKAELAHACPPRPRLAEHPALPPCAGVRALVLLLQPVIIPVSTHGEERVQFYFRTQDSGGAGPQWDGNILTHVAREHGL
jgi:hypothetical protein